MKPSQSLFEQVELIGKLADLKLDHYQQSVVLHALIELLIDKGIIAEQELASRAIAQYATPPSPQRPML